MAVRVCGTLQAMAIDTSRRRFAASLPLALMAGPRAAFAQDDEVVKLIVPYAAGGASDVLARTVTPTMARGLGKSVVVENVSGVGGALGAQKVLDTGRGGQALLVGTLSELVLTPLASPSVKYRPQDFRLLCVLAQAPVVLFARPDFPGRSVDEVLALARAPGAKPLSYSSSGVGSLFHLIGASFAERAGVEMTHVAYRGVALAVQDLAAGVVDLAFFPMIPTFAQLLEAGRVKPIAVLARQRSASLANVPTADESVGLKNFHFDAWSGIFAPADLGLGIANRLASAANEGVATPAFQKLMASITSTAGVPMTLQEAEGYYQREVERFTGIARKTKL